MSASTVIGAIHAQFLRRATLEIASIFRRINLHPADDIAFDD
jgi:hypothetical protein